MIRFTPRRIRRLSVIAGVCVLTAMFYMVVDPSRTWWAPKCVFRMVTGLECPGCGSQRMVYALLHGDFAGAWEANPFLLSALPLIGVWIWVDTDPGLYPRATRVLNSRGFIIIVGVLIIGWWIIRNL